MTVSPEDDLFTKKHNRLLSIASFANFFAWLALAVSILLAISNFFSTGNLYNSQMIASGINTDFYKTLLSDYFYDFHLILNLLNIIFQGIIYWIVLTGTSMGLNMIVETDINYRIASQEVSHE